MIFGIGAILYIVARIYGAVLGETVYQYAGRTIGGNNHNVAAGLIALIGIALMVLSILKLLWRLLP